MAAPSVPHRDTRRQTPGTVPRRDPTTWAGRIAACVAVATVAGIDPWSPSPAGPLRPTLVVAVVLVGAALVVRSPLRGGVSRVWLVLLVWLAVGALWSADPLHAWIGTPERRLGWLAWLLFALAFAVGGAVRAAPDRRLLARAVGAAAGAAGAWACAEALGLAPVPAGFTTRSGGPFAQPAYLGAALALTVPVAVALATDRHEGRARSLWAVAAGLGVVGLAASGSRAAWVGVVVALGVAALARHRPRTATAAPASAVVAHAHDDATPRRRRVHRGLGLVATLIVVALVAGAGVLDRAGSVGAGADARIAEWRTAARAVAAAPVIGHGPEGYRLVFGEVVDAGYVQRHGRAVITDRAHSAPLDMAVVGGVPGAALLVVLWVLIGRRAVAALRRGDPVVAGLAAGWLAHTTAGLALFALLEIDPLAWLCAGAVVAWHDPPAPVEPSDRASPIAVATVIAAIAVLIAGTADVAVERRIGQATEPTLPVAARQAHAEAAARLRPDSVRAAHAAAQVSAAAGAITDLDAALAHLERGLAISPLDPALATTYALRAAERAERSRLPGDVAAAEVIVDARLDRDPHHPLLWRARAVIAELAGDDRAGEVARRTAEQLDGGRR